MPRPSQRRQDCQDRKRFGRGEGNGHEIHGRNSEARRKFRFAHGKKSRSVDHVLSILPTGEKEQSVLSGLLILSTTSYQFYRHAKKNNQCCLGY